MLMALLIAAAAPCAPPAAWTSANTATVMLVGIPARIVLKLAAEVALAAPAGRAAKPATHAGLVPLDVKRGGRIEIALSSAAYVDLVRDGKALTSVAHRHGAPCSGARKVVAFEVTPGRYTIQISDAPEASVTMSATIG